MTLVASSQNGVRSSVRKTPLVVEPKWRLILRRNNAFESVEPKWRRILRRNNAFGRVEPKWRRILLVSCRVVWWDVVSWGVVSWGVVSWGVVSMYLDILIRKGSPVGHPCLYKFDLSMYLHILIRKGAQSDTLVRTSLVFHVPPHLDTDGKPSRTPLFVQVLVSGPGPP
jgi:hypothetical protein